MRLPTLPFVLVIGCVLLLSGASVEKASQRPPPGLGETESKEPQTYSKSSQQESTKDNRGIEDTPFVVKTITPPKTEEEAAQDAYEREQKAASDWWVIGLTGALVFVGLMQVAVYSAQACYMRRGLKLTQQAANAARDSAEVATRQVSLIANIERPWFTVKGQLTRWETINFQNPAPVKIPVACSLRNTGRSPGFLNKFSVHLVLRPLPIPDERPQYKEENVLRGKVVLVPNDSFEWPMSINLSHEEIRDIMAGKSCIVLYGCFKYEDSTPAAHITRFCIHWSVIDPKRPLDAFGFIPTGPPSYIEYT